MLLRCCTVTLLLLVGCAHCLHDTFDDCVNSWCEFPSDEDGERYTTRLTLETTVHWHQPCITAVTSQTFNAEGSVVSRVNATFLCHLSTTSYLWTPLQGRTFWFTESPFVKGFWLNHWLVVRHLSVNVYNMSLDQSFVSSLRGNLLKELELRGNRWPTTSGLTLQLHNLKKLSLADNEIEELHPGSLAGCLNLEVLDLSRNKIRSYSHVLPSLKPFKPALRELNLGENIISTVVNISWHASWSMKINLSYNQISSVELDAIPKNSEIDLSFNNITEFYSHLYSFRVDRMVLAGQTISSLSEVGTILSVIDRELFEYPFRSLEVEYDNRNSVHSLYFAQSVCTLDRKFIYCGGNAPNIAPSRQSTFINLTGNAQKMFRLSVSEIWPEDLDLSKNHLKDIIELPSQISNTKTLNLSRNSIRYIRRHVFQKMTRLTVLDLSYNQLKHVQLILYSSLFMLDISNNNLNRMNISHNSSKFIAEYLNLSHNSFTYILAAEWSQFDQFSKVDLGENKLQCCGPEGQYSRTLILHFRNKILNLNSSQALTCVRPYYGSVEITNTWLHEDHCQTNIHVWVAFGCLLFLMPLFMHAAELLDYFIHQTERDLAEQLTRLKKQGLEQDEICALGCQYDAFVCHSHKDAGFVRYELVPNLENDRDGHRLCIHYRDFQLGSFIEENVEKAMNTSRKVIVVVTRSFLQSNWCMMELTFAWEKMVREGRNYIIVIEVDRLPKGKRPPILSYLMRSRTYLEWPEAPTDDDKKECWSRVRDALGKSLRDRQQEQSESGTAAFQMDC